MPECSTGRTINYNILLSGSLKGGNGHPHHLLFGTCLIHSFKYIM